MPNQEVHSDYSKALSPLIQRFCQYGAVTRFAAPEWASKRHGRALHGASTDVTRGGQKTPWCAGVRPQNSPALPPLRCPILPVRHGLGTGNPTTVTLSTSRACWKRWRGASPLRTSPRKWRTEKNMGNEFPFGRNSVPGHRKGEKALCP